MWKWLSRFLPLHWLLREHPQLLGPFDVGTVRARLPGAPGGDGPGLLAQVSYPASAAGHPLEGYHEKWFRPEVIERIAGYMGLNVHVAMKILSGVDQLSKPLPPTGKFGGWPIIVFSSGLRGVCEMYTQLVMDLASVGYIVVAVEHEDGAGFYATDRLNGTVIEYRNPAEGEEDDAAFRDPFLEKRTDELDMTTKALLAAARREASPVTGHDRTTLLAAVLAGGDPDRMFLAGHSFGAAGMVRYIRNCREKKLTFPYKGALFFDIWTVALQGQDVTQSLGIPFAVLMSEEWAKDPLYLPGHRKLFDANSDNLRAAVLVRGTLHQWIAESMYFLRVWLLRKLGLAGDANPKQAYRSTALAAAGMSMNLLGRGGERLTLRDGHFYTVPTEGQLLEPWILQMDTDLLRSWRPEGPDPK